MLYSIITFLFLFISLGKGESFPAKMVRSADKFHFQDIFSGRFSPAMYSCDWVDGEFKSIYQIL